MALWLRGSTAQSVCLTSPGEPREAAPKAKPCPVTRKGAPFFDLPSTTRLQVVQRSLSGGFLTEDAVLLNANARSMLDEAKHHAWGEGRP